MLNCNRINLTVKVESHTQKYQGRRKKKREKGGGGVRVGRKGKRERGKKRERERESVFPVCFPPQPCNICIY